MGKVINKKMLDVFKKDFNDLDKNGNGVLELEEVEMLAERQLGRKMGIKEVIRSSNTHRGSLTLTFN